MASNNNFLESDDTKKSIELAQQLEASLPKVKWCMSPYLYLYQNFWCPSDILSNVVTLQAEFEAQDTDILLATKPKSGTTWLKALSFSILHRQNHPTDHHPLLSTNPHDLGPWIESPPPGTPVLEEVLRLDPPRMYNTHLPYQALPESVRANSRGCRIVYLCRNPFDTVVSFLKYKELVVDEGWKKGEEVEPLELEEFVDSFCKGVEWFGPHWDHVLGYWNASLENPDKVLFLKYEDMKMDGISVIKRLANFLRVPFTEDEEKNGVIGDILKLSSFQNMKELEVNRNGRLPDYDIENKVFFRKGSVGNWKNHMTPALFDRLDKVMEEKFGGTGLTFKTSF